MRLRTARVLLHVPMSKILLLTIKTALRRWQRGGNGWLKSLFSACIFLLLYALWTDLYFWSSQDVCHHLNSRRAKPLTLSLWLTVQSAGQASTSLAKLCIGKEFLKVALRKGQLSFFFRFSSSPHSVFLLAAASCNGYAQIVVFWKFCTLMAGIMTCIGYYSCLMDYQMGLNWLIMPKDRF